MKRDGGYNAFAERMGQLESSGRYDAVNRFGFLGRYQFGKARLIDLGLMMKGGIWLHGLTTDKFLMSPKLQEWTFAVHTGRHLADANRRYATKFGGLVGSGESAVEITPSGIVAAAHLVGMGSVNKMIRTGEVPTDGNGVKATLYLFELGGFDLPSWLPREIPSSIILDCNLKK